MNINKSGITIKPFSSTEIGPCAKLYAEIFGKPPWNEKWSFMEAMSKVKKLINKKTFIGFAAEYNGITAGYLLGYQLNAVWPLSRVYYINELFVDMEYQNRKIGKRLVEALIHDLIGKKIPWIVLITKRDTNAERFYRKRGFERVLSGPGLTKRIMMRYRLGQQEMEEDR